MVKNIQTAGIIGFFICLFIMYMTNTGIRGIREYDPSFHLPDMKFHYRTEQIISDFHQIGEKGRAIYQKYLLLDSAFVFCFLIVMLTVTNRIFIGTIFQNILIFVCLLRAVFDLLENTLLFIALKNYPTVRDNIISVSSCFTSLKFTMLYIWLLSLTIRFIIILKKSL